MTGGLNDRTGHRPIKMWAHVKITHPRHAYYGRTGTVIRFSNKTRKVWVALPEGTVVPAGHRSVEVIVPQAQRR